ncbi:Splicing factor 3b subunit 4 protein [Dioscorea alata]|uniref:Splicing factor 3b subunit 4 protein n=2 Tax=Dioscorea alata TaxID=55571 RepID=A0ACB7W971_DIOAL|nr:Splicing factor 3b subunit 4 protein [Dioscorea alata]KAH7684229.1 Splicing factor 3b subunit 4 protein [Dioscorea alata]
MAKGGGSRDVSRRDFDLRFEERGRSSGWGVAPPSRHLWVGNLSPEVSPSVLSDQFLKFGDLEDISYVPGRNYAFVNYMKKDDAGHAMRALQGAIIEGMPLRIEFAKGDKEYQRYDNERHSHKHGDARPIQSGKSYDSSKGNKDAEPSEILWIGFPLPMNIDESVLRRAFSPFGEIERITTFPGRSYAFVQYRSVTSACRAKEALHGKLLDNPRIRVCFAKGDVPPDLGRSLSNVPHPPRFRSNIHPGPSERTLEAFHGERGFESPTSGFQVSSPPFIPNFERMHGDSGAVGSGRTGTVQAGLGPGRNPGAPFEHIRLQEFGSHRLPGDTYERYQNSPRRDRDAQWDNPPLERHRRSPFSEDSWVVGDANFPSVKKLKTDSFSDRELPEYPFTEFEKNKHDSIPKRSYPSMHEPHSFNGNIDSLPFGLKGLLNHPRNLPCPPAENDDSWRSSDAFNAGPAPPPLGSSKLQNLSSEYHQSVPLELWKWEGTIAKGGAPICRARCFPVGKVLDFMLPEFLDCTARTGLDMLAKHYYQAAGTWVVFFVPETDADIVFYNELLHYLSEKQRAAVAKLGDKISLFLVPPSEFSEHVLKVPGKMSISGLILKFQHSDSCSSSFHYPMDAMEFKLPTLMARPSDGTTLREDASFIKPSSPISRTSLGNLAPHNLGDSLPYLGAIHPREMQPEFNMEIRHGQPQQPQQPQQLNPALKLSWSSDMYIPNPSIVSFPPLPPNAASHSVGNSMEEKYPIANPRLAPETSSGNYTPETSGIIHFPNSKLPQLQESKQSSSLPMPLQPEQLAQLATFLGQHKQVGREFVSSTDASLSSNPGFISHASVSSGPAGPQTVYPPLPSIPAGVQAIHPPLPSMPPRPHVAHASISPGMMVDRIMNASLPSNSAEPQLSQAGSLQLHLPQDVTGVQGNPALPNIQQAPNRTMEEGEPDPQKRLQATLQLAASLLQQIQQQSKT